MDYKIIRLNTNQADITTSDKKNFTFFLRHPIILNEEYLLNINELIIDTTYAAGGRTITAPLIQDLYILAGTNSNWGTTSLGVYYLYDQFSLRTLTFEVYMNQSGIKDARLLALTINYAFNTNGEFYILARATAPFYTLLGAQSTLTHATLGSNFIWGKNDDFGTYHSNLRILTEPSVGKRYKISIDNIQHLTFEYNNSNRIYCPVIAEIQHTHSDTLNKIDNNLLTLPPQIISCIKLIIEDSDGYGITAVGDNMSVCFLLQKKKYLEIIDNGINEAA
jgi:hypothetical protein